MIILITGITSGFGKAMAERLSSEGHTVFGTHRKATDFLPNVNYLKVDVTDSHSVEMAVNEVIDREGRIDVFINNAGMGVGGPLEFTSLEDAQYQMDVNWMGMVRFLHHVVPVMRKQGGGKIICFSSIGGVMGLPYQGVYSASKYAIEGYCEALRLETRRFNISVTVIRPGDFATAFTAQRKVVEAPEAHAVYKSYAKSLASIEHDENSGLKPQFMAKRVSRIVRKRNPRYSYVIASPLQRLSIAAKRILPPKWFALVLSMYYKLGN